MNRHFGNLLLLRQLRTGSSVKLLQNVCIKVFNLRNTGGAGQNGFDLMKIEVVGLCLGVGRNLWGCLRE